MKVVLFCGGLGLRLRGYSDDVPKPMVPIGSRPILWHLMKYYAHHGHTDFILCLGHRADTIEHFFLTYEERLATDRVLHGGNGAAAPVSGSDVGDWRITLVDTGLTANVGERLMQVREHIGEDEMFLANYSDNLTDAPLGPQIAYLERRPELVGSFMSVVPSLSLHSVTVAADGIVEAIQPITRTGLLVNGGFFVFRRQIFDYIEAGEELVEEPFARLIGERSLVGHRHPGFWAAMDTLKDWRMLEDLHQQGPAPWALWRRTAVTV